MESISIEPIPKLPKPVLDAYTDEKLIFFIGAGISRLQNLPGWDQLASQLISEAFTLSESNQIKASISDRKQLITIAYHHMRKNKQLRKFYRIFGQCLKSKTKPKEDIYALLFQFRAIFITTNYDGLMEKKLGKICCTTDCTQTKFIQAKPRYLFYIHGRYVDKDKSDKESLILTCDQYIKKYSDPDFQSFLHTLFEDYTILFLGYGLNEFELLDNMLRKAGSRSDKRYFILEGFFGYQEPLSAAKSKYYDALNVELIAYNKDKKGYKQQFDIIEYWIEQLKSSTNYSFQQINAVYQRISNKSALDMQEIRNEIMTDYSQVLLPPIFKAINESEEYIGWVEYIFDQGLYCLDLGKLQGATNNDYENSPNRLIDGLKDLIIQKPLDMDLQKLCGRILYAILSEFINLPADSPLRKNIRLIRTLTDFAVNLNAKSIPDNTVTFLQNIDSQYHNYLMRSLSRSSQFVDWDMQSFGSVFSYFYCPALLDTNGESNYFVQQFFEKNRNISPDKAQMILELIVNTIDVKGKQLLRYLVIASVDSIVFNSKEISICYAIRKCLDKIKQQDAEEFVYNGINAFKTNPILSKLCINILGKQTSLPFSINRIHINPWESSVIMYEWMKCILLRSKELCASDYIELFKWIDKAGCKESLKGERRKKYLNYRKWQIAELAHAIYPQFAQTMQKFAAVIGDSSKLKTIAQDLNNDFDDGYKKEKQEIENFGLKILAMDETEMLEAYHQEYNNPTDHVQRMLSVYIADWVKARIKNGDTNFNFYLYLPMIMNGYIFWELTTFKPENEQTLHVLYELAYGFVEQLLNSSNEGIDHIESSLKAGFHILENILSINEAYATLIHEFCSQHINAFSIYRISTAAYYSADDIINDVRGGLYSLYLRSVFVIAKHGNQVKHSISSVDKENFSKPNTIMRYVMAMNLSRFYALDWKFTSEVLNNIFGKDKHTIALVSIGSGFSNQIFKPTTRYIIDNELLIPWDEQKETADKANNLRKSLFLYMGIAFYFDQISTEEATILLKSAPIEKAEDFVSGISTNLNIDFNPDMLTQKIVRLKVMIDEIFILEHKKLLYSTLVRIMDERIQLTNDIVKTCTECICSIGECSMFFDDELIETNDHVDIITWYEFYMALIIAANCFFSSEEIENVFSAFQKGGIDKNKLTEFLSAGFNNNKINGDVFYRLSKKI